MKAWPHGVYINQRGPKYIDWTENEENGDPNLHDDRNWWIFSSLCQSSGKSIYKPCICLRRILTRNKDKSYPILHTIAFPNFKMKIDKILRGVHLFTVSMSRVLSLESPDVSRERNSDDSFRS